MQSIYSYWSNFSTGWFWMAMAQTRAQKGPKPMQLLLVDISNIDRSMNLNDIIIHHMHCIFLQINKKICH
jgi:hypothetical protein